MDVRILIIDEHTIFREGLACHFEQQNGFEVVGQAGDGPSAVEAASQCRPDLVLLGPLTRGMTSAETARALAGACPDARVICMAMSGLPEHVAEMKSAGVRGYLVRRSNFRELTEAISRVMEGGEYLCPEVRAPSDDRRHRSRRDASPSCAPPAVLSERETEIVRLVAAGRRRDEIARMLSIPLATYDKHKHKLMKKLGLSTDSDLTKFALRQGLASIDDA